MLPFVDADLRKIASGVVEKAKEACVTRSVILRFFFLMRREVKTHLNLLRKRKYKRGRVELGVLVVDIHIAFDLEFGYLIYFCGLFLVL